MSLTKEERIELILMAGSGNCSETVAAFNRKFDKNITEHTVDQLINKFRETGSVEDQMRSGAPGAFPAEEHRTQQRNEDLPFSTPEDPPLSVQEEGVSSVESFQTSNNLEQDVHDTDVSLEEYIEQINSRMTNEDEKKAALIKLTVEVLEVLSDLHQKHYIHGDVKLRNVQVDKGQPKLINTPSSKVKTGDDQKIKDEICKAKNLVHYILSGGKNYNGRNSDWSLTDLEWDFIEVMTKKGRSLKETLDHPIFWTDYRRLKYLETLSNLNLKVSQTRKKKDDLKTFVNWKSKIKNPNLLMEMEEQRPEPYPEDLLGLLRFIRNFLQHRSEEKIDFIFRYFPDLFEKVYFLACDMEWNFRVSVKRVFSDWS